jgi:hypothetical protein
MAQDLLDRFTPLHMQPINNSNVATLVLRTGHRALKFKTAVNRAAYFAGVLSSLYNGSGLLVTLVWTMASPATVRWGIAFERQADGVFAYTGASFASEVLMTATAPVAANRATYSTMTFSGGTAIDSLAILESYRMVVTRHGTVDGSGDAYLHRVILQNAI